MTTILRLGLASEVTNVTSAATGKKAKTQVGVVSISYGTEIFIIMFTQPPNDLAGLMK